MVSGESGCESYPPLTKWIDEITWSKCCAEPETFTECTVSTINIDQGKHIFSSKVCGVYLLSLKLTKKY